MTSADASELVHYGLQELQGFTRHMLGVVAQFQATGTLPELKYAGLPGPSGEENGTLKSAVKQTAKKSKAAKAVSEANGDAPKKTRALTAFNWFVKAQIQDMKQKGVVPPVDAEGKALNFMTMASARWKELGQKGQQDFAAHFKTLLEKGEIPDAGATKKRKAEDEEAAAAQAVSEIVAKVASPSKGVSDVNDTPVTADKAKMKKDEASAAAASDVVQAAGSPAGPATQDAAQEEGIKKKKKKRHHSSAGADTTPGQAGSSAEDAAKSEEKKKKKHKKKHRESTAAATAN